MGDRPERNSVDADEHFDKIFREAAEIVEHTQAAVREKGAKARFDLPYDVIRVFGDEERQALMREIWEYAESAVGNSFNVANGQGGMINPQQLISMLAPQLFLAFMAGYRHATEEIEIPPVNVLFVEDDPVNDPKEGDE